MDKLARIDTIIQPSDEFATVGIAFENLSHFPLLYFIDSNIMDSIKDKWVASASNTVRMAPEIQIPKKNA